MKIAVMFVVALSALLHTGAGAAAEGNGARLLKPHYDVNRETLRRGAKLFASHCLGCHNLKYLRYNRVADDLDMTKHEVEWMLMTPGGAEYNKGMISNLDSDDAANWFGTAPPDLTLEARYRGEDWIYTYLKSFYLDPERPLGWNNHLFHNVAMPNILAPLGGVHDAQGNLLVKGSMSQQQFDQATRDLTAWLQYASDPSILKRRALGPWVIGFLVIFSILAYLLKRAYWRDIH